MFYFQICEYEFHQNTNFQKDFKYLLLIEVCCSCHCASRTGIVLVIFPELYDVQFSGRFSIQNWNSSLDAAFDWFLMATHQQFNTFSGLS